MIKRILLFLAALLCYTSIIQGQSFEITPYASYTFGGTTPTRYGELKVRESDAYGGAFDVLLPSNFAIQLGYWRQATMAEHRSYAFPQYNENAMLTMDWYQIGGYKVVPVNEKVSPFGGITLGATNFILESENQINEWSFAVTLQGGVKFYLNDRLGLRLHARLLMPLQWSGFGFYAGSGGAGAGVNAGTYFVQGDVGGGLIIRLGN